MSKTKTRNFAVILYPDSLPEEWKAKLTSLGIPMAISPLHDKDKSERKSPEAVRKEADRRAANQCKAIENPFDRQVKYEEAREYWKGVVEHEQANLPEFKKPHYHVLYVNPNPVTSDSVRNKLKRALGEQAVSHVEIVDNVEHYYRYLTHESADAIEKKKHRYDAKDIVLLNNFDIDRYVTMDKAQKKEMFAHLLDFVDEQNIMNLKQLKFFIREHGGDIGIKNTQELIEICNENHGMLRMMFDANWQESNLHGKQVN